MTIFPSTRRHTVKFRCCCGVRRVAKLIPETFFIFTRACWNVLRKLSDKNGGGSLTALPIIETQAGDVSAYIPTNVISITDGQIYFGDRSVQPGYSPRGERWIVREPRRRFSAQIKAMRQVAGTLKLELAQYRELAAFAQFGSDLDKATQAQLNRGKRLVEVLKQNQFSPLPFSKQILIIFAGTSGCLDDLCRSSRSREFEAALYKYVDASQSAASANHHGEESSR